MTDSNFGCVVVALLVVAVGAVIVTVGAVSALYRPVALVSFWVAALSLAAVGVLAVVRFRKN